jgi:eukaryotic-like serine/threonine-protein kinase
VIKFKEKRGPDHRTTLTCMHNLAAGYAATNHKDEAIALYRETLAKRRATLGADHPATMLTLTNLAVLYAYGEKPSDAIPLFEEILQQQRKKHGPDSPAALTAMANLGAGYREAGRVKVGLPLVEEALAKARKLPNGLPATSVWMLSAMAVTYDADGQFATAEPVYREFLERTRKQLGPNHPQTAMALGGLGSNLLKQKKYEQAEKYTRESLDIRTRKTPDDWQTFSMKSQLGAALLGQQKHAAAAPLLLEGYAGMQERVAQIPLSGRPRLRQTAERLVELYEATGEKDKADAWRLKSDEAKR